MISVSQLALLKADILVNNNQINFGSVMTAIKDLPNNPDANIEIATWYNGFPGTDFWVWRSSVSRAEVYNTRSDVPSDWDWTFYKNQAVTEQNSWVQMFMGDQADFSKLNLRVGISKIFTAGSSVNRDHAFAIGRKKASNIEKLLATPITGAPANSGNDNVVGNQGKTTNPSSAVYDSIMSGPLQGSDVTAARNS